jgi:hypothetical protein
MKIFKEGEKSRGICQTCKKLVPTTFKVTTVPLCSGKGKVDNILAAICDQCAHLVSIPQQSTPRIREIIASRKRSIEARLPRHLLDILILAGDKLEMGSPESLKDSLIRYYIAMAEEDKTMIKNIKKFSESDFAKGTSDRLSLKVNEAIYQIFEELKAKTRLSKTQIIKGLILQINQDILQKPTKKLIENLRKIMLVSV